MKLALAVLAAVLAVAVLVALNVRAFVAAEREQLVARAERVLGRPVHVGAVTSSWWPLGLRMHAVRVDDDDRAGTPLATADAVVIPLSLRSLAVGTVTAGGVRLERPVLHVVRDTRGKWNVAALVRADGRSGRAGRGDAGRGDGRRAAFELPIEWVIGIARARIDDGTIIVDDESGAVPRRLTLAAVHVDGREIRFGADARIAADAEVHGDDLIAHVHLDAAVPHAGENEAAHTPFTATIVARDVRLRPASTLAGLTIPVSGRIDEIRAELSGTSTKFTTDVTAHTTAGGAGRRTAALAADVPIALRGRVVTTGPEILLDDTRLTIGALTLAVSGGMNTQAPSANLEVQSLGDGAVTLAVAEPPLAVRDVHGTVIVAGGRATIGAGLRADDIPIDLAGAVRGVVPWLGDLRLDAAPFGGALHAEVTADERAAAVHATVRDVNLAAALARVVPTFAGNVDGLAGGHVALTALGAGAALRDAAVTGSGEITVTGGRLHGTNLAARVLSGVTGGAALPRLLSARGRTHYDEALGGDDTVFARARVPFSVAGGRVVVDDAHLEGDAFEVTGNGWLALGGDDEVRFHGDLALGAAVSAALTDDVAAIRLLRGADGRVTIPFRVRGPLGRAHPEPDPKRLRERGLDALFADQGGGGRGDDTRGDPAARHGSRHDDLARELLERAERMIRP